MPLSASTEPPKPADSDLDFFGLTHQGLVRKENQDHFLICTIHKIMLVRSTSLPNPELLEMPSPRLASFSMVADGAGGLAGGETASRAAVEAIASYVTDTMRTFYRSNASDDDAFLAELQEAAAQSHKAVVARAEESGDPKGMATTLTLLLGVWPHLYILHVGDSRYYRLREGKLELLTRDQTMAQDLVDSGILPQAKMKRSPFAHVLSSSLGGTSSPVVTRNDIQPGDVQLLCTDGLTKHVSDERIHEVLSALTSSEQACQTLVNEAIAAGGTDNVTVVVLRLKTGSQGARELAS
jgi:serine/threonine protein phosphatase PrpC